jgi:hypothetical protein
MMAAAQINSGFINRSKGDHTPTNPYRGAEAPSRMLPENGSPR